MEDLSNRSYITGSFIDSLWLGGKIQESIYLYLLT
jgi:hypothetical protein